MLCQLTIKNFALIDYFQIDFQSQLSVLTGETGAGKSILIDALSLTLGCRADSKMIRHGTQQCDITAEFDISQLDLAKAWLEMNALTEPHQQECLLRRIINLDGKSRAFINGQPVTLQQLNTLSHFLIDIHGQNEHHFLLEKDQQLLLLDEFGNHQFLLDPIKALHKEWELLIQEKESLLKINPTDREQDFLRFQLDELEELNLQTEELSQLEQEYKMLSQAENILSRTQESMNLLVEDEHNLLHQLQHIQQKLIPLASIESGFENTLKNLSQAEVGITEAALELKNYLSHFNTNPDRCTWIEKRLEKIYQLARKHKVSPENLSELKTEFATKLIRSNDTQSLLSDLEKKEQLILEQYNKIAMELSKKRLSTAKKLSEAITHEMQNLAMSAGQFLIKFEKNNQKINPKGLERCEFWVQPNLGHPPQPLGKIASGGELSRISLAIQVILAAHSQVPTLIFDEVDVGIGGSTANVVGQLLQKLSSKAQILCVTHLPQVAVFGHHHYQIQKKISGEQTITAVQKLDNQKRIEEIARMLSGKKITKQSLAHASELLEQAHEKI